ncbi:PREDICTED: phosphatidylinositol 5-phosphate 4-kinase type-2 gamma-like [Ficedula albicollis]|uniref:phosphatidylinositol 5-phosphate 4-kinase type-2 gamma-like n=1 Tax=Ficedula albicollis TaxID=59894 RepID=UPI0007AD7FE1|nr:PREDICTED: phosphatidylinositol 5-phosphate 4-kinase type-2 gamma-like [Ficedula albicollis]
MPSPRPQQLSGRCSPSLEHPQVCGRKRHSEAQPRPAAGAASGPLSPVPCPLPLCPQVSLTRSAPRWAGGRHLLLSADRTLVLKELSSEGVADVHGLLSHYHQYVVQCHGQTLLPRFLGMYRVSVDSEDTYLLVMRNLFSHRLPVHRKYDLKGCFGGCSPPPRPPQGKELPTLKDVDFLNKNEKVFVEEEQQREFMDKLKRDVEGLGVWGVSPWGHGVAPHPK